MSESKTNQFDYTLPPLPYFSYGQEKEDALEYGQACAEAARAPLLARIAELEAIVNTPQADDFLRAVSTEAEHQRLRWGNQHDAGKTAADWYWLIGYLAGKSLHAHSSGDMAKAEHHVITTAAACANWHRAMLGKTDMRPGIDGPAAMKESGDA